MIGASRRWAARAAAVVAASALLVSPLVAAAPAGAASSRAARTEAAQAGVPGPTIHWGSCHNSAIPSGFQCATLAVPVDGDEIGDAGPTFPLALDRYQATGHRIGDLLINPGGPGESGVDELPSIVSDLSSDLTSHFDIIGFDPPGVGASDPVDCLGSQAFATYLNLDPAPPTAKGVATLVAGNRTFAQGCEARSKNILPHVSTVAAARDMDRIRRALGDAKLNYLGFSYGTFLGATYAGLYPTKVRAMVLDGAIDPSLSPVTMIEAQAEAIDGELRQLEAACASDSSCSWQAPKPGPGQKHDSGAARLAAAFQALVTKVRAHPVSVSGTGQSVGPAELLYGTADGLYSTAEWGSLEDALQSLTKGDGSSILSMYNSYEGRQSNGTYQNTLEAESAVNCVDAPAPTVSQLVQDGKALEPKAPVFGLLDLYSEMTCSVWPVKATGTVHPIHAPGSPPIVVVGSTGDPVTPYAWAVSLAHQLSHGVLLTRVGDGHTAYFSSSCVRKAADAYFVNLQPPKVGERCSSD